MKTATEDELHQIFKNLSEDQKEKLEVYAVATGCNVKFNNCWDHWHQNYQLDYCGDGADAWVSKTNSLGDWIQVSCEYPKLWTSVILQGRGDYEDQWVKTVKFASTITGKTWSNVQNGKIFEANSDRNTKVKICFNQPVYSRVLRIYPQSWHIRNALRFQAIYLDI